MNKSQLKRALAETETRLARAHSDLAKAQEKVRTLTQRIPELQQAVNSLRVLVGVKPPKLKKASVLFDEINRITVNGGKELVVPFIEKMTPEQALKFAAPRDLSGFGSIPYNKDVPPSTEPEELPDAEGEEILD